MRTLSSLLLLLIVVGSTAVSAQNPPQLRLTQSLRIGSTDRANFDLSYVSDVAVSADGTIYVGQPVENTIRVYSATGTFVRRIGRKGKGPGEFENIDALESTQRGLYALDMAAGRLTLFAPDGSVRITWPRVRNVWGDPHFALPPLRQMDNGLMISIPTSRASPGRPPITEPVGLFKADNSHIRDIAKIETGNNTRTVTAGQLVSVIGIPNATGLLYAIAPWQNAIYTVDRLIGDDRRTSSFTLRKIGTAGDTLFTTTLTTPTRLIDQKQLNVERDRRVEVTIRNRPFTRAQVAPIYDIGWADVKYQTPIDAVAIGRDGTIWLRRGSFAETSAEWLVFDANGRNTARATVPVSTRVMRVTRTAIWVVERDDDDVEYVVRYSVTGVR